MEKEKPHIHVKNVNLDANVLKRLNIGIDEVVEYIENKKAIDMKPVHVKAHQYWKNHPTVASS